MENTENVRISFGPFGSLSKRTLIFIGIVIALSLVLFLVGILSAAHKIRSDAAEASRIMMEEKASETKQTDLSAALRTSTVNTVLETNYIPAYSLSEVMAMDVSKPSGVTVEDLKKVTTQGLVGLEEAFWQAEQDYGINCLFVMAIAAIESGNGTINGVGNNMFGWGGGYIAFSSKAEGIDVVARGLAKNYLTPGSGLYSGKTISSVNKRYASSSTWDDKVAKKMVSYYATISKTHNTELEKLK